MGGFELIAPDVWRLALMPRDALNVYVLRDVLVDAGFRVTARRLLPALRTRTVVAHALTHAHADHQGGSHRVCSELGVPLLCGRGDREAVEAGDPARLLPAAKTLEGLLNRRFAGPSHPVATVLEEGDVVGGFRVLETPGHTPGHLAFWREADGVLILGDVLFHRNPVTLRAGLREPFVTATLDPGQNRDSARRLAALRPRLVCFGHGEPLEDGRRFVHYVQTLQGCR